MNPVLILTHNCLELTKRCVESVRKQDIPVSIHIYDNQSSDGTQAWIESQEDIVDQSSGVDLGVSGGWNFVLEILFKEQWERPGHKMQGWGAEHVLAINNDTILAPFSYKELLRTGSQFVTGVSSENLGEVMSEDNHWHGVLTDGPDFSAFLIRKAAWEKIGPFNEEMAIYCSDVDYDIRARKLGIVLNNSHVKFYHERSSTLNLASPEDRAAIQERSNKDHLAFKAKYGMMPGQPGYERLWQVQELAKDGK